MESDLLKKAIPVLEFLAGTESDTDQRVRTDKLIVRYVQQLRINEGISAGGSSSGAAPVQLFGQKLNGSPLVVVLHNDSARLVSPLQRRLEEQATESLADAIRGLPHDTPVNFLRSGRVDPEKSRPLFDRPRVADASTKRKALEWLYQRPESSLRNQDGLPLADVIEQLVKDLDETALVVLVSLGSHRYFPVPQSALEKVAGSSSCPRIFVVARKKNLLLAQIVAASKGSAVILKGSGGPFGARNIVVEPWDVSVKESN
jgi:hypothetical protein